MRSLELIMLEKMIISLFITILLILKIKVDIYIKISIFIIIYLIIFKIIENIFNKSKELKIYNIIYIILVFYLFIFPIIKLDNNEIDEQENRVLSKKSQLITQEGINLNFSIETQNWLNDHFYKRKYIINKNRKINELITGRIESELAFLGKEDWIFYKGDNSIQNYQNMNLFSEEELEKIKNNLILRKKYFNSKNIKYYTFVAPDKNRIYGAYYPDYIKKVNTNGKVKQLQLYLKNKKEEIVPTIIYPYEILLDKSKKDLTYWKNDTHWNTYGAYIGYLELIKEIKKDFPDIEEVKEENLNIKEELFLREDLLKILSINDEKRINKYQNTLYKTLSLKNQSFQYILNKGINGKEGLITKSDKKYKVLIFRDSFTISLVPYISETFGEVNYVWKQDINEFEDLINSYKPDIVIFEMVERYIDILKIDFILKEEN